MTIVDESIGDISGGMPTTTSPQVKVTDITLEGGVPLFLVEGPLGSTCVGGTVEQVRAQTHHWRRLLEYMNQHSEQG